MKQKSGRVAQRGESAQPLREFAMFKTVFTFAGRQAFSGGGWSEKTLTTQSERFACSGRRPPQRVERFWLCDSCATLWTLVQDATHAITLVPLVRPIVGLQPQLSNAYRQIVQGPFRPTGT